MFATSHTEASLSALASEADACVVIGTNEDLHAAERLADSHQKQQQQQPTSSPPPPPLLRMGTVAGMSLAKAISQRYAPFYALQWRRADKAFACNSVEAVTARLVRDSVRPLPMLILTNEVQPSRVAALRDALLQSTNLSEVVVLRDLPELRERAPDNFALYTYELEIARSAVEVVETFKQHNTITALCCCFCMAGRRPTRTRSTGWWRSSANQLATAAGRTSPPPPFSEEVRGSGCVGELAALAWRAPPRAVRDSCCDRRR